MKRLLSLCLGVILAGCSKPPVTAPDCGCCGTPSDTTLTVCDTLAQAPVPLAVVDLSVSNPRGVHATNIVITCDEPIIRDTLYADNQAGSDAKYVTFYETSSGTQPYRRYYFHSVNGDTLLIPNSTNGTTTQFNLTVGDVPAGTYNRVSTYRGTIAAPQDAARSYGITQTLWHLGLRGIEHIWCVECRTITRPK